MVRRTGRKIDSYLGQPIYEAIEDEEGVYRFDRVAEAEPDGGYPLNQLRGDEKMVDPGLIYRRVANDG